MYVSIDEFEKTIMVRTTDPIMLSLNPHAFSFFVSGKDIYTTDGIIFVAKEKLSMHNSYIIFLDDEGNTYKFSISSSGVSNAHIFEGNSKKLIGKKIVKYRVTIGTAHGDIEVLEGSQLLLSDAIEACYKKYEEVKKGTKK